MSVEIDLQIAGKFTNIPTLKQFQKWTNAALRHLSRKKYDIVIRIVKKSESASLNQQYRQKKGPTNVLSFPFTPPKQIKSKLLGDLVICAPIVSKEAKEQKKPLSAHWAHLVIHGVLHLLGYDHIKKRDAAVMEQLEIQILAELGFANPYLENK